MSATRRVRVFSIASALALLVAAAWGAPARGQCVSATSVAEFQSSGDHVGLWKYTFSVTWGGVQQGASNFTFVLALGPCSCVCDEGMWVFDPSAGTSSGADPQSGDPCVADYVGEFNCQGNPSVQEVDGPSVQWAATAGCDPGPSGQGVLVLYTPNGPTGPSTGDLWLKAGPDACLGVVTGQLPGCTACPTDTDPSTWGKIKALYR